MGQTSLLRGQIETAEKHINKALEILEKRNHPERYISLETLSELYLNKSKDLKQQAIDCLQQAHHIVKDFFPSDSPHIVRIQARIKSLS